MDPVSIGIGAVAILIAGVTLYYNRRAALSAERIEDKQSEADAAELDGEAPPADFPEIVSGDIRPDRAVVGREADVAALRRGLVSKSAAAIVPGTVVRGQGGMGKSTLARYYAERYRRSYRGLWWLRAQSRQTLLTDLGALGAALGVADGGGGPEALAKATLARLITEPGPWLLIYDNAEAYGPDGDAFGIRDWRPGGGEVHLLITSREGGWPNGFEVVQAERLAEDRAIDLLLQESERDDRAGAARLAAALDGLPLALVNAGAWLRDTRSVSFDDYLAELGERIGDRPAEIPGMAADYPDSVFGAVKLSIEKLSAEARLVLEVLAFLDPDALWPGLFEALAEKEGDPHPEWKAVLEPVPEALWTLVRRAGGVERVFAELGHRSLLEREGETWRLHRLTGAVQRALLGEAGAERREVAASVLAAAYAQAGNPQYADAWPLCARLQPHVAALAADPPATAAMDILLNQASVFLDRQGEFDLALGYAEESLRLKEARLGPEHREVGTACNNLAVRLWRLGRIEAAEGYADRAVRIADAGGGTEADRATRLMVHGIMLDMLGRQQSCVARRERFRQSADRYRQALALRLRLHGRAHLETAKVINNLATLRAYQGRWGAALRLHGRALGLRRQCLPAGDPELANSLLNLGITLLKAGRARAGYRGEGALDLLTRALEIRVAAFPDRPRHPNRVGAARRLAQAHLALDRLGPPLPDMTRPDPARARALCAEYALDFDKESAAADLIVTRTQAHDRGDPVGPMPGEGED